MSEKKKNSNKKAYGTITEKGNGKYLVTYDFGKVNEKRERQSKQFDDYDEAEKALQEHAREMRNNQAIPKRFTIENMIAEWKTNGKNKNNWAITTMYGYIFVCISGGALLLIVLLVVLKKRSRQAKMQY